MPIDGISCNPANSNYNQSAQSPSFKAVSGNFLNEAVRIATIKKDLRLCYKDKGISKPDKEIFQEAKQKSDYIYNLFKPIIDKVSGIPKEIIDLTINITSHDNKSFDLIISGTGKNNNIFVDGDNLLRSSSKSDKSQLKQNLQVFMQENGI